MVKLVTSPKEAIENIDRFGVELDASPALQERLAYGRWWYATHENGTWRFGPSKFIGYSGLGAAQYLALARKEMDGRDTEEHLRKWFNGVDPASKLNSELAQALTAFLARYHKSPSARAKFKVLRGAAVNDGDAGEEMPMVDLIVAVDKTLPESQRKALRARLAG